VTGAVFLGGVAAGLLGSGHCAGMCGTLVAALSLSGPDRGGAAFHALYHAGRVSTYVGLGWAAGHLGLAAARCGGLPALGRALLLGADALVILAGLGTAAGVGWLDLARLEPRGLARPLGALAVVLRRLPPALGALPLGMALGLLPCGLLYGILANAALSGDPAEGAALMFGFGVGTAPVLLASGATARLLSARSRGWMLRAAGLSVALLGAYNLGRHLLAPTCH